MSDPAVFLNAFAHVLAVMTLYPEAHPIRERALDAAYAELDGLTGQASRTCALASRLVHVCDVYDALGTNRPYRAAWPTEKTTAYLEERAGTEFDPDMVSAFLKMLREGEARVRVLTEDATVSRPVQKA